MVKRPALVRPPAFQRYSCHSCGQCCRGLFTIRVTPEEQARIEAQGWADRPELDGLPLFRQVGGATALTHRADGACVFLDDDNHCRIHAEFGEETKPLPCRLYPFVFVPDGLKVRVDLRFDCPSVAGNKGRSLTEHFAELGELLPQAVPPRAEEPEVAMTPANPVSWQSIRLATAEVDAMLTDISLPLQHRMLAAGLFAESLKVTPFDRFDGARLKDYLTELRRANVALALRDDETGPSRPSRAVLVLFRQLLAFHGRADRIGEPPRRLRRLGIALRMVAGRGGVPRIQPTFPQVSFAAIERPWPSLDGEAAQALVRFYQVRLAGFGFFGPIAGGLRYAEGLQALLLSYPLILWYARLFAAGEGADRLTFEAVVRAIQVVDHRHGRRVGPEVSDLHRRRAILSEPANLRALMLAYGGVEESAQEG